MTAFSAALALATIGFGSIDSGSPALLLSADELAAGARGLHVSEAGTYEVRAWSDPSKRWRLDTEARPLVLESVETEAAAPSIPSWTTLGTVELEADVPFEIQIKRPEADPGDDETPPPPPPPLPAFLAIQKAGSPDLGAGLDVLRGRIHTDEPSPDLRKTEARTVDRGVDFQPPDSASAWLARADELRSQLRVTLGLAPELPRTDLSAQVYGELERDGYTIEKVVLETMPGYLLSGSLYRPTDPPSGKSPAILSPHGHYEVGRMHPDVQMRCVRLAKLGFVVFAYDMVGYNDSKPFGHAFLSPSLRRWGFGLPTLQTWNSLRAVDFLAGLPDVDPTRIGCTGSSGGGTQTILITAVEPRIRVSAPVVMVSELYQGGSFCENIAGMRVGTDNVEIAALTAPRPLRLVGATGDWTVNTTSVVLPKLRAVYELFGAGGLVEADVFTYPHNYNKTSREAVYPFLARHLLGLDDPEATREGEQKVEEAADLLTFDDEHPRPSTILSPEELEAQVISARAEAIEELAPSDDPARWAASRRVLTEILRVRVGVEIPVGDALESAPVRRADRDGAIIEHWRLSRAGADDAVPAVVIRPRGEVRSTAIVALDRGKAGLVEADGTFSPLVSELLGRGVAVVGYDPIFVGEAFDPGLPRTSRLEGDHDDTYNRSLAGEHLQDLATVASWAASRSDWAAVHLIAEGDSAALALLARPVLPMLGRTAIVLDEDAPKPSSAELPKGLDLAGIFQFGGLPAAAALSAPSPLWLSGPGSELGGWPERAYEVEGAGSQLRHDAEAPDPDALAAWIAGDVL